MSNIEIAVRTAGYKENPQNYQKVPYIPYNQVAVVCLNGDGNKDDRANNAAAKIVQNELSERLETTMPVYSVKYNFDYNSPADERKLQFIKYHQNTLSPLQTDLNFMRQATPEEKNPAYIRQLFNQVLLHRLSDYNTGNKLPVIEACRRIRMLTFIAHCHGGFVALKLENYMQQYMQSLGYSKAERQEIQSQMCIIASSPACPLGISRSAFYSFYSAKDYCNPQDKSSRLGNTVFNNFIYHKSRIDQKLCRDLGPFMASLHPQAFNFSPCYFSREKLFLIKEKYPADDENPIQEHNCKFQDFCQTKDGKHLNWLRGNILANAVRNSFMQKDHFVALPPIEALILNFDKDCAITLSQQIKNFAAMNKSAANLRKSATAYWQARNSSYHK